jgi:hypothetical protein
MRNQSAAAQNMLNQPAATGVPPPAKADLPTTGITRNFLRVAIAIMLGDCHLWHGTGTVHATVTKNALHSSSQMSIGIPD